MRLLDRSPFLEEPSELMFKTEPIRVRPFQIILWVSLTPKRIDVPNPRDLPFPAILDTGYSHTFSIREKHLIEWAGIRPDTMPLMGSARDRDERVPLRSANIWVHPNVRRNRDLMAPRPPMAVAAPKGIGVYSGDFPRLPILGLRAIADNGLILQANGIRREATLRTQHGFWPLVW